MFRVVRKQIRPNNTVNFYSTPTETATWINENYILTGKILNSEFRVSDNGLELTMTADWVSMEENLAWRSDPYVVENVLTAMSDYCTANGIELITVSTAEVA